jgi:hypothetical protein
MVAAGVLLVVMLALGVSGLWPGVPVLLLAALVGGLLARRRAAEHKRLRQQRLLLEDTLEGRVLLIEDKLAQLAKHRTELAARYDLAERQLEPTLAGASVDEKAQVLRKMRASQLALQERLKALEARYLKVRAELDTASRQEQAEGRSVEVAQALEALHQEHAQANDALDDLGFELDAEIEVRRIARG